MDRCIPRSKPVAHVDPFYTGYVAVATSGITVTWRSYRIPSYTVLYSWYLLVSCEF